MADIEADIEVDVVVLGWGKGGKTLAGALGRAGRSVAVVERSPDMYGGSCINLNCVPTKTLIHQARSRPDQTSAETWFRTSVGRRDDLVAKMRARNHAMLADIDTVTLVEGTARFLDSHRVEARRGGDTSVIAAETVVINTGTVPARPPIPGAATSARVHDSTSLQHVDPLPRRLVIVGGGYVGLEFAGMFAGFGSDVILVDHHDELMPGEDRDVATAVRSLLESQGVEILTGTEVSEVREEGPATFVTLTEADVQGGSDVAREVAADAVLLATGRRPATEGLGLDAAGVMVDERGYVVVDERLRTTAPGVFAVGDVNGGPQFTYVSLDDYRIVADQLSAAGTRTITDRVAVPATTFLVPPLARVGLNETQARAQGRQVLVASKAVADIAAMPRPKILGETRGLIKVVVDAETDQVVGATLLCVDAQEVINLIALAMRTGTTASQLRDGIWTHPSTTEALNEVLDALRPLA